MCYSAPRAEVHYNHRYRMHMFQIPKPRNALVVAKGRLEWLLVETDLVETQR